MASLSDSLGKLVNNEANVRITFKNSDVKYFAHKLILSCRSNVFHTMFYGAVKVVTTDSDEFEIADVKPHIFLELLRFMYTDHIHLNEENFADIVYASHKYNIECLDSFCADYLSKHLDVNNVCSFLNQCFIYDNEVTEECLLLIDLTIDDLMKLKKLDQLSDDALTMVVERDTLRVKEVDLFKFMIKRTESPSETNEPLAKRQKVRNPIFEKLRFPTMSVDEFSECFKLKPELFATDEISSIFKCCSSGIQDDGLLYSTTKRVYEAQFNSDNQNVITFEGTKISIQKTHELKFRVRKPVALCGIDFTTPLVDMKLYELDAIGKVRNLHIHTTRVFSLQRNAVVTFASDIILLPKIQYVIETHSDCGNKLICERVTKDSELKDLFDFTYFCTIVKKLSFKVQSRKR